MWTEIGKTMLVQAVLWLGLASLGLAAFTLYYATGRAKGYGGVLLAVAMVAILFTLLTQLPASGPVVDVGMDDVEVFGSGLAVAGAIIGGVLGVAVFMVLVWKK